MPADRSPPGIHARLLHAAAPVKSRAPECAAARMRQSTIVAESSVTGNIRPSFSVLSSTPRPSNQATVSAGPKPVKGPMSSREPRGKHCGQNVPRVKAGVRDIAPAARRRRAPSPADGPSPRGAVTSAPRVGLGAGDRAKEAGRSAARDQDPATLGSWVRRACGVRPA